MAGIALFTLSSLACGAAGSQTILVTFRSLQGVGGAVVASVTLSIVVALFSGLVSTSQMIGGVIGLAILAGVATTRTGSALATGQAPKLALNAGYQAAFALAAALALVATLIAASQLRPVRALPPQAGDVQAGEKQPVPDRELVAADR